MHIVSDYTITFDGGSIGNPGPGYGSYRLRGPDGATRTRRLDFGDDVTNNVAEYRALIAALEDLLATIQRAGQDPAHSSVEVRGDSRLVIYQLDGRWRVRKPHLRPLHDRARALLNQFGSATLKWHRRGESVKALGH